MARQQDTHPLIAVVSRLLVAQAFASAVIGIAFSRRHVPWLVLTILVAVALCGLAAVVRSGSHSTWLVAICAAVSIAARSLSRPWAALSARTRQCTTTVLDWRSSTATTNRPTNPVAEGPGPELHGAVLDERDGAHAIPLHFVRPALTVGRQAARRCQHRPDPAGQDLPPRVSHSI